MFEAYDGVIESDGGVKVYDNDRIIGEVRAFPYEDGTFVHYLGYVKDGQWLRPDQNEEEIRDMKLQYPKLGLELMRWSRENLEPPFYAAFANQELRRVLKAEPTGEVIPPEETGEPDDVSIDRLRVAAFLIEAATFDEVVELLKRTDLKEGSKYDKRYPGVIPTLLEAIEGLNEEYQDDVKWALREFVALNKGAIKKHIDTLANHKWELEQEGNQEEAERVNETIMSNLSSFKSRIFGRKRELMALAEVKPILDRYNMTFDWDRAKEDGLSIVLQNINLAVADREEYRNLIEEAKELAEDGELWNGDIVHQFDNGWAMWELQGNEDAEKEGELASHCIGDPQYGHCTAIAEQNIRAFSLRDKNQIPWATITFSDDLSLVGEAYARHDHAIPAEHQEMISEWLKKENPDSEWFIPDEGSRTGLFSGLNDIREDLEAEEEEDDLWERPEDWPRREPIYPTTSAILIDHPQDLHLEVSSLKANLSYADGEVEGLAYGWESYDEEEPIVWLNPPMPYEVEDSFEGSLYSYLEDPALSYEDLAKTALYFATFALYEYETGSPEDGPIHQIWEKMREDPRAESPGVGTFLDIVEEVYDDNSSLSSVLRTGGEDIADYIKMYPDPRLAEGEYPILTDPSVGDEEPSMEWRPGQSELELPQLQAIRQAVADWDLNSMIQIMDSIFPALPPHDHLRRVLGRVYRAILFQSEPIADPYRDNARIRRDIQSIQAQSLQDLDAKIEVARGRNDVPWRSDLFGENQLTLAKVVWFRESATIQDLDQSYVMRTGDIIADIYEIQSSARVGAFDSASEELERIMQTLSEANPEMLQGESGELLRDLEVAIYQEDGEEVLQLTPYLFYIFGNEPLYDYQTGAA